MNLTQDYCIFYVCTLLQCHSLKNTGTKCSNLTSFHGLDHKQICHMESNALLCTTAIEIFTKFDTTFVLDLAAQREQRFFTIRSSGSGEAPPRNGSSRGCRLSTPGDFRGFVGWQQPPILTGALNLVMMHRDTERFSRPRDETANRGPFLVFFSIAPFRLA